MDEEQSFGIDPRTLAQAMADRLPAFVEDLRLLSGIDCGTANKAGVDTVGAWVRERCRTNGWAVRVYPQQEAGDLVKAIVSGRGTGSLLLLAHMDTVYPDGVAAARPMRVEGDRILGPGTADMKAGLLAGIYALEALCALERRPFGEVAFLFTSDEETGSAVARPFIEEAARRCDAGLVLEAARASGAIVAARKGVHEYTLSIQGRAAHAGVEPEKGRNALLEMAHQIIALQGLNGQIPGVTVNAGVAQGGTKVNVVPESATLEVEARAFDPAGLAAIDQLIRAIAAAPAVPDTTISLTMHPGFPPMPRTAATEGLAALARSIAADLGFDLEAVSTGGASDASLVAGVGVPVLDGLGPIGGDDHSPREWVALDSIVPRTALLAALIARISE